MAIMGMSSKSEVLVYFVAMTLGIASLLTFNAFVAAPDYMTNYYRHTLNDPNATAQRPVFWKNVESIISLGSLVPNLAGQVLMLTAAARSTGCLLRLNVAAGIMVLMVLLVALLPTVGSSEEVAIGLLMLAVALSGLGTAIFQSTMFSMFGAFPSAHTAGVLTGVGISGSAISLLQVIIKASSEDTFDASRRTASIFFGIAIGWLVIAIVAANFLTVNAFARSYIPTPYALPTIACCLKTEDESESAKVNVCSVLLRIRAMLFSTFLTLTVTLTVFPGIGVSINPSSWFGVIIVLLFNVGDTIGRAGSNIQRIWLPRRALPIIAVIRLVLIPAFVVLSRVHWTDWIFPQALMLVTGITNGFIGSLGMVYGPSTDTIHTPEERRTAGTAMSLALLTGAALGSVMDFVATAV